jgi:hypothetical protein
MNINISFPTHRHDHQPHTRPSHPIQHLYMRRSNSPSPSLQPLPTNPTPPKLTFYPRQRSKPGWGSNKTSTQGQKSGKGAGLQSANRLSVGRKGKSAGTASIFRMLLMGKTTNETRKKAKQLQLKNPMPLLKPPNKTEGELLLSQRVNISMATKQLKNRSGVSFLEEFGHHARSERSGRECGRELGYHQGIGGGYKCGR